MGVSFDPFGNIVVSGYTKGSQQGRSFGDFDGFLRKVSSDGSFQWLSQWGTVEADYVSNVVRGPGTTFLVAGTTDGPLSRASAGASDIYVKRIKVP